MRIFFYLFFLLCSFHLWGYSFWETKTSFDQEYELQGFRSHCSLNYSAFNFFFGGNFIHNNPEDYTLAASLYGFYLGPLNRNGLYKIIRSEQGISWSAFNEKSSIRLNRDSRNSLNQGLAWQKHWGGFFYQFGVRERSAGLHLTPGPFQAVFMFTENLKKEVSLTDSWYQAEENSAMEMLHASLTWDLSSWGVRMNSTLCASPYGAPGAAGVLQGRWKYSSLRLHLLAAAYTPCYRSSTGDKSDIRAQLKNKVALPLGNHVLLKQKGAWSWLSNYRNWEAVLTPSAHCFFLKSAEMGLINKIEGSSFEGWKYPVPEVYIKGELYTWGGELSCSMDYNAEIWQLKGRLRYRHMEFQSTIIGESNWYLNHCGIRWSPGNMDFSCLWDKDFSTLECKWKWKF